MCTFKINCAVLILNIFKILRKLKPNPVKKNDQDWKMHRNVIPPCLHAM